MSSLKQRIADKEQEVLRNRGRFRRERHYLRDSASESIRSPKLLAGGFAIGLALALLRCRGGTAEGAHTINTAAAPIRSLQWLLRNLGPPIIMTLLHRAATEPDDEFDDIADT